MRLSLVFLIVFILHIHWVCGDSDIVLPQSTEKNATVETKPEIEVKHSDDSKNITITPSVAMNKLLKQEQEQKEQKKEKEPEEQSSIEVNLQALLVFSSSQIKCHQISNFTK